MLKGELVKTVTSDGIELQGFWVNKNSDLVVFHSHGTAGDFYTHKFIEIEGKKLSSKNTSFLTANNRGHDVYADLRKHIKGKVDWVQIGGALERFEDCLFDIKAWLDFLTKRGVKKVILQSHSLSQKILYYQHLKHDRRVIGQIHLSPQNDAGLMLYSLGEKKYNQINSKIKKMFKEGKGTEMLPKELSPVSPMTSAQTYYGYLTEEGVGTLTPFHNPDSKNWQVLQETRDPMLAVFGGKDVYIKPSIKEAAQLFKKKAKSSKHVEVKIIEDASHSFVGYENQLVDTIYNWVKKIASV